MDGGPAAKQSLFLLLCQSPQLQSHSVCCLGESGESRPHCRTLVRCTVAAAVVGDVVAVDRWDPLSILKVWARRTDDTILLQLPATPSNGCDLVTRRKWSSRRVQTWAWRARRGTRRSLHRWPMKDSKIDRTWLENNKQTFHDVILLNMTSCLW